MAEPHTQTRRRRGASTPRRVLLLTGAMIALVLGGLFLAHPASAATAAPASPAAARQPVLPNGPDSTARETAIVKYSEPRAPAGGACSVPGIGDFGELLGFCNSGSGVVGDLNNVCEPSVPQPEQATAGLDSMVAPPGSAVGGKTLYDNYGVAGQFWSAYGLQCSDMTSLIGNNVAGMVFDAAKSIDRVTITVYQAAAGNGILTWLQNAVNKLITALGKAIFFPFLAPVVIIGAIWLAWQGLVRKRASRTIEGTLWMVVACFAAIWLIGQPSTFTGIGANVSNGVTQVLNTAFDKLPSPGTSNCLPVQSGDPESVASNYAFTSGNGLIDDNANELWSVLVCKPWLLGEFGTSNYATSTTGKQTVVNQYGRDLLWAQAIAANEQPTQSLITAKQDAYVGIAKSLQTNDPSAYALFQGNQWTTRLEIGFSAMFAALAAGLLVLLISLTLIVLKLGWLLLLVAGPFFLIVGIHPGFGRIIAIRWFEMLVGVLLKQVAIALVLSVLLYCYALIMGTPDVVLPWALKILMIALVTVAVYIYRKPFTHLFSSVGYGMIGSSDRAEYHYREGATTFRRATGTAGSVLPGVAAYRAARWARRNQVPAGAAADAATAAGTAGAAASGAVAGAAAANGASTGGAAAAAGAGAGAGAGGNGHAGGHTVSRLRADGAAAPADGSGDGGTGNGVDAGSGGPGSGGASAGGRPRQWPAAGNGSGGGGRSAPPLPLPKEGNGSGGASAGWARNTAGWSGGGSAAGTGGGTGRAPARPAAPPARPPGNGAGGGAGGNGGSRASAAPASGSTPSIPNPPMTRGSGAASGRSGGGAPDRSGKSGSVADGNPSPARFWQRRGK